MKQFITFFLFISILCNTLAQENCSDCIDNDGDGLIDCYDPDCADSVAVCNNLFIKNRNALGICLNASKSNNDLKMSLLYRIDSVQGASLAKFFVADVDNDGISEIVNYNLGNTITTFNGIDGSISNKISVVPATIFNLSSSPAIADIDNDGFAEFFIMGLADIDSFSYQISCFEHDGTLKYVSDTVFYKSDGAFFEPPVGFANFDNSDTANVYVGGCILNGLTGKIIAQSAIIDGNSAAVDLLADGDCPDCSGLELAFSNKVYSVDIANRTMTLRKIKTDSIAGGNIAIADYDNDGKLDIIVNEDTTFKQIVWNPRTETIIEQIHTISGVSGGGFGAVNVGNFDNDAGLEMGIVTTTHYIAVDHDMTELWRKPILESTSGYTGSTLFDFNGDGITEIAYRDEQFLRIINATNGLTIDSFPCVSGTGGEYPTVVDVNQDGHADILCGCKSVSGPDHIIAVTSACNTWVASREIWNQSYYFNVNINDDLTIPCVQQNHAHDSLSSLNGFLNQANILDNNGDIIKYTKLNDAIISIDSVVGISCNNLKAYVTICNNKTNGDWIIGSECSPFSLYQGDPKSGGVLILDTFLNQHIRPDSCVQYILDVPSESYVLFAYVNDDGSNPIGAPNTVFLECDTSNNYDSLSILDTTLISIIGLDSIYCLNDLSDTLIGNPAGGTFSGIGILGDVFTPTVAGIGGPYIITYQITNPCPLIVTDSTSVKNVSTLQNTNDTTICLGDTIDLQIIQGNIINWLVTTNLSCGDCSNPRAYPNSNINYIVNITDSIIGCSTMDSILITVDTIPFLVVSNDTFICLGDSVQISGFGPSGSVWTNTLGNLTCTNCTSQFVKPNSTTTYFYSFNENACPATKDSIIITVFNPPALILCCNDTIPFGGSSLLNAIGSPPFNWTPITWLDLPNSSNPTTTPDSTITYYMTQVSTEGCVNTDSVTIYVINEFLVFPNAFTPDNDGLNDEFKVFQSGLKELNYIKIYNRWGQMVYFSKDLQMGWDGNFMGKAQEIGTYHYEIEAINFEDKTIRQKGTIALIR